MTSFDKLFDLFDAHDHELYMVGGCVRDLLMGHTPKDFDFATSAHPKEIKTTLRSGGLRVTPIGEAFGTIATDVDGAEVEITTYRVKESYTKGSRHPQVVFGHDLETDLSRRDLTINAMAMDRHGSVIDPFGGQRDMEAQLLRVPGGGVAKTKEIFEDDPLRMLRVCRFVARYGFQPDSATTTAARFEARRILEVSRERWQSEFERIWPGRQIMAGLRWLESVGVLGICLPEVTALAGLREGYEDVLTRTLRLVSALPPTPLLRWAGMLHAISAPQVHDGECPIDQAAATSAAMAEVISRRFRFSNADRSVLTFLVRHHDLVQRTAPLQRVDVRRVLIEAPAWVEPLKVLMQEAAAVRGEVAAAPARVQFERFVAHEAALATMQPLEPHLPKGLGERLMTTLEIPRGPRLGEMMRWLREEIMHERLPNEAAFECYVQAASKRLQWSEEP